MVPNWHDFPRSPARSILLADDHQAYRETLAEALGRAGYRTFQAGTGREALIVVRQRRVHAAILDGTLPDMTGLELFGLLGRIAVIPAILLTSHPTEALRARALALGMRALWGKSVGLAELQRAIAGVLFGVLWDEARDDDRDDEAREHEAPHDEAREHDPDAPGTSAPEAGAWF